ncbi:competence protein ComK [Tuberibacillus sp. Marseille-P3662]|uniref:competence protein ComK n=1 Tax=Tuberibacillus sp. Marseille-P3662 TaxID=1965358 RepID=UPI000A1CF033|nr:competence protein ComK [Tuberibacillus sp. Marseille-P3662]
MEKVLTEQDHYEISRSTMALIPYNHSLYNLKVIDTEGDHYLIKSPTQLIHEACVARASTYDGRRKAVKMHLHIPKKVPIPVSPIENIYVFPTHSPDQFHCHWIAYRHIHDIHSLTNQTSLVTFKNGRQLKLNLSYYSLEKQLHRTTYCMSSYSKIDECLTLLHTLCNKLGAPITTI